MRRVRGAELMDGPEADVAQLSRSLLDLRGVNRWLGGHRAAVRRVLQMARSLGDREVTVLDLGTGGADVPLTLAREARRRGIRLRITATDLHPVTLEFARVATRGEPLIQVMPADARSLPFARDAFDIAICCTTLHHFDEAEAVTVLREMDRVALYGIVVTDLARSRLALLGALFLANSVWRRHPITRHDGPVSVRAAFTAAELRGLTTGAIDGPVRVSRDWIFRLALVVDRTSYTSLEGAPSSSL